MNMQGKKVLLGITGGIAAYKTPELVRRLKDHSIEVRVVLTESAKAFVTPLSLQAVSGNKVSDSLLDEDAELAMGHIELAKWADLIIIAPATANIIAKISCGLADDLLSTLCLATEAPIAIAPAMNQAMWKNVATQHNIALLQQRGVHILGPDSGEQACGDVGLGRMLDVPELVAEVVRLLQPKEQTLAGQHWVITAGPTQEAIDPVRYISNHSSGKMGYAIAQTAQQLGASVTLISGPTQLNTPNGCTRIDVLSAEQMHQHALALSENCDVFVACAAVADYRVAKPSEQKIKKTDDNDQLQLILVKNPDIVADVASQSNKPFVVGFAAETQQVEQYAKDKLKRKNLDLIAANDVSNAEHGFNSDKNALTVFSPSSQHQIPSASKSQVAEQLVELINTYFQRKA